MITAFRWTLVAVLAGHGLIHLLGAAKGFGWAQVPPLTQPAGTTRAVLWLAAALLVLGAAYGFASVGPSSFHAQWREQATSALTDVDPTPPVLAEADLADLPGPL